jgi:predicted nucleotidyltransferase
VDSSKSQQIIADYYGGKPGVVAVYLFGSVARGTARADSDVDIGVLYDSPRPAQLLAQPFDDEASLAERLARRVQVIEMNDAPPDLVHRILRDGILVIDANKSRRIAFEVRARNEYFDLLPIIRQYRQRPSA